MSHLIHDGAALKDIYLFLAKAKSTKVKPQKGEVELWKWAPCDEADRYLADHYQAAWKEVGGRILCQAKAPSLRTGLGGVNG